MIKSIMERLHKHHFGGNSTVRLARDLFFWPGMRNQIEEMCNSCSDCAKFSKTAQKEPMKSLPIPTLPWKIVSQDLFELDDKDYLYNVLYNDLDSNPVPLCYRLALVHLHPRCGLSRAPNHGAASGRTCMGDFLQRCWYRGRVCNRVL